MPKVPVVGAARAASDGLHGFPSAPGGIPNAKTSRGVRRGIAAIRSRGATGTAIAPEQP